MDEVAKRIANPKDYVGAKPYLSITLDDGYRDNLTNAVPVFRRQQVPYTIYIAPGLTEAKAPLWWEDIEHVIAAQKKISIDLATGRKEFDVSTTDNKKAAYKFLMYNLLVETDQYVQREIVAKFCKAYSFDCEGHVRIA